MDRSGEIVAGLAQLGGPLGDAHLEASAVLFDDEVADGVVDRHHDRRHDEREQLRSLARIGRCVGEDGELAGAVTTAALEDLLHRRGAAVATLDRAADLHPVDLGIQLHARPREAGLLHERARDGFEREIEIEVVLDELVDRVRGP